MNGTRPSQPTKSEAKETETYLVGWSIGESNAGTRPRKRNQGPRTEWPIGVWKEVLRAEDLGKAMGGMDWGRCIGLGGGRGMEY